MKKALSIMFALLLLFLLPACGGEEDDYDGDTPSGGDGGNGDNGGWESQEDQDYEILKTSGFTYIHSLVIGSNDTLYVGGTAQEESKKSDAFLVAFDTKGKELWSKQWDYQESADTVTEVVADKQGNIYVIGGYIPFVIKFASDGTKIWEQFPEFDRITSLALDSQQNVYISYDNEIVKYSADGKKLRAYEIFEKSTITVLAIDSENNIYAGGRTSDSLFGENVGKKDIFLIKLAPDGTQIWGEQWGTAADDYVSSLIIDNDNKIYVDGYTYEESGIFVKFSSDGEKAWEISQQCYFATICNDNIYCINNNQIYKYNSNGEYLGNLVAYEADSLERIACDNKENVYVSTKKSTKIIKISSSEIK